MLGHRRKFSGVFFFVFTGTALLTKKDDTYTLWLEQRRLIRLPFLLLLQVRLSSYFIICDDSRQ